MNFAKQFRVAPQTKLSLAAIDPDFKGDKSKQALRALTKRNLARLQQLQEMLYAEHKRALLICLQAIDAGGKDGTINHVFSSMNPQGSRVASFKTPAGVERDHDFLWRAHREAPAIGEVTIFNRSHYEEVLIVRTQRLAPKAVWSKHYGQINDFEKMLSENGTHIVKFFLHISKDEQLKRFKARLDDPSKHWKLSTADYRERERWDDYMAAFEDMLSKCSTADAPWFVIPANHKSFRDYAISQLLVDYMEGLQMQYPPPADLKEIRELYRQAKKDA